MKKINNSGLRACALTALLAAGGFVSCAEDGDDDSKQPPVGPPVELVNQIMCDGQTIDIRSAIWEADTNGGYVFYLSPRAGIGHVEDMLSTDDYLMVQVTDPKGTVDVATEPFLIRYKTFSVNAMTMPADAEKVELSVDLLEGTPTLNLYAFVQMKAQQGGKEAAPVAGRTLLVRYNGASAQAKPVVLNRQWQFNRELTAIAGVLEWRHADRNVYYLCDRDDVAAPPTAETGTDFVQISVASDLTGEIDLATADREKVVLSYGEFSTATAVAVSGTLRISKDKTGSQLTVALESVIDGQKLRAAYTGSFDAGYQSADFFRVTTAEGVAFEAPLWTVFRKEPHNVTQLFAMGDREKPAVPAQLMEGRYALQFNVVKLDEVHDAATSKQYSLKLFDYATFRTWDATKGATGTLETRRPNADDGRVYLRFDITFPDGTHAQGEWYGNLTAADEQFDLTPVRPFRPHFQLLSKDKDVTKELDITALEVRKETRTVEGTGPHTLYYFYFRNADTESGGGGDVDEASNTPCLYVLEDQINAGEMDLTLLKGKPYWHVDYWPLNMSGLGSPASQYSYPADPVAYGTLSVAKDADGEWTISMDVQDNVASSYSSSKQYLRIEWQGAASAYTGSKKNEL